MIHWNDLVPELQAALLAARLHGYLQPGKPSPKSPRRHLRVHLEDGWNRGLLATTGNGYALTDEGNALVDAHMQAVDDLRQAVEQQIVDTLVGAAEATTIIKDTVTGIMHGIPEREPFNEVVYAKAAENDLPELVRDMYLSTARTRYDATGEELLPLDWFSSYMTTLWHINGQRKHALTRIRDTAKANAGKCITCNTIAGIAASALEEK